MSGYMLTTSSTINCTHGGKIILSTSNNKLFVSNAPVLLESDIHTVAGCPFTVGLKYSPCIRVEWAGGEQKVTVRGTKVLSTSSIGKCFNAEGTLQGVSIIVNTQRRGSIL